LKANFRYLAFWTLNSMTFCKYINVYFHRFPVSQQFMTTFSSHFQTFSVNLLIHKNLNTIFALMFIFENSQGIFRIILKPTCFYLLFLEKSVLSSFTQFYFLNKDSGFVSLIPSPPCSSTSLSKNARFPICFLGLL